MRKLACIVLLAAACGGKKEEKKAEETEKSIEQPEVPAPKKPKGPPGVERPQPDAKMAVGGAAVTLRSAFLWQRADGPFEILATTVPSSCERSTARMRMMEDGEQDVDVFIEKKLKPDGTFGWGITQASFGSMTMAGGGGDVTVEGDGSPGSSNKITLKFEVGGDKPMTFEGTLDALGCAPPAPEGEPAKAPPPAQAGNITVAGQKVPIAGAVIEQKGDVRELVLSNAEATCDGFPHGVDDSVSVSFHFREKEDVAHQIDLTGAWFSGQLATQLMDKGTLTVKPSRVPEGATTVELELGGKLDIQGFATELDGKVTAQVCPPK